jgi:hypothetical protein
MKSRTVLLDKITVGLIYWQQENTFPNDSLSNNVRKRTNGDDSYHTNN